MGSSGCEVNDLVNVMRDFSFKRLTLLHLSWSKIDGFKTRNCREDCDFEGATFRGFPFLDGELLTSPRCFGFFFDWLEFRIRIS